MTDPQTRYSAVASGFSGETYSSNMPELWTEPPSVDASTRYPRLNPPPHADPEIPPSRPTPETEEPPRRARPDPDALLYQDEAVAVYGDRVVIYFYYFPVGFWKTVKIDKIEAVQAGTFPWYKKKTWGLAGKTWWALGCCREFRPSQQHVIIKRKNARCGMGFTPRDPLQVKSLIEERIT